MESSESSPDPLGQPDLSSPSNLRSPPSRSRRSVGADAGGSSGRKGSGGGRQRRFAPATATNIARAGITDSAKVARRVSELSLATPSPEPVLFEESRRSLTPPARRLLSPWRPRTGGRTMVEDNGRSLRVTSRVGPPANDNLFQAVTTTVPLKTGEETPQGRKKSRVSTPRRRRATPIASRQRSDAAVGTPAKPALSTEAGSPTPLKRGTGRADIEADAALDAALDPVFPAFRFERPPKTVAVNGASPGKRRRVLSADSTNTADTIEDHRAGHVETVQPVPTRSAADSLDRLSTRPQDEPSARTASATESRDPTDDHAEFDSIMESEDFTMVSLSSIPSGQQLRSLAKGETVPAKSKKLSADVLRREASLNSASDRNAGNVRSVPALPSLPKANQKASISYGNGLLSAFSPATRRELRAGLRLGQELAKNPKSNKKNQAHLQGSMATPKEDSLSNTEDVPDQGARSPLRENEALAERQAEEVTVDIFADLAAAEASDTSAQAAASRTARSQSGVSRSNTSPRITPGSRRRQLPSPDQSDEHEYSKASGTKMSWRYDTPARAHLAQSSLRKQQLVNGELNKTPPPVQSYENPTHSSPDKQLFMEQAAAEAEASLTNAREQDMSSDGESDSSDDEQPPELSEATKSLLADTSFDSWQSGTDVVQSLVNDGAKEDRELLPQLVKADPEGFTNDFAGRVESESESPSDDDTEVSTSDHTEKKGLNNSRRLPPRSPVEAPDSRHPLITIFEDEDSNGGNESGSTASSPVEDDAVDQGGLPSKTISSLQNSQTKTDVRNASDEINNVRGSGVISSSPPALRARAPTINQQQAKTPATEELYPPKRGKLLSLWRRQSDEPIIYSDEVELPPSEDVSLLPTSGKRRKSQLTPENRKRGRYDDADFSVLSEFKAKAPSGSVPGRDLPSSPSKRVRFESEDRENPYFPTTPIYNDYPTLTKHAERDFEQELTGSSEEEAEDSQGSVRWEEKQPSQSSGQRGTWLSGLLPAWFKTPRSPVFRFSLPNLPQLHLRKGGAASQSSIRFRRGVSPSASGESPAKSSVANVTTEAYTPSVPPASFSSAHYRHLKKLYDAALVQPSPATMTRHRPEIARLLGWEIRRLGWKKRVNEWELGIIAEFLRRDNPLAHNVTPEQVARRLFSIWAVEVQKGRTGLGSATPGLFSTQYIAQRDQVIRRARRLRSLAAT